MTGSAPQFADNGAASISCQTQDAFLVYLSAPDGQEAERIARGLVEKGLAAGINIIPGAVSIYRWQGEIRRKEEHLLIAQASAGALEGIAEHIRAHHSYIVPCVLWLPVAGGAKNFLQWITASSRAEYAG